MDYKEEQEQEIEILQSIYPDELSIISENQFSINLLLETSSERKHRLELVVEYPETYPEIAPILNIQHGELLEIDGDQDDEDSDDTDDEDDVDDGETGGGKVVLIAEQINFDDEDLEKLRNLLIEEAEDQIGIPSIFALASSLKDHAEQIFEKKVQVQQKLYDEQLLAKEREEQKKFYGTKVTTESFNEWRSKFRVEFGIEDRIEERRRKQHNGKLSGKEIFERGLAGDVDVEELSATTEELTTEG